MSPRAKASPASLGFWRRGWSEKKGRPKDVALRHAREMKEPAIRALVLEVLVSRFALPRWSSTTFGEDLRAACKLYGVALAKLTAKEKAVRAARAREQQKTKKKAASAAAADR